VSNQFQQAMRLMRRRDPQQAEDGFHHLRAMAADHVDELIDEFLREHDHGLRCWLLELIGDAASGKALPVLAVELHSNDEALQDWAVRGLRKLDTPQARRLLWNWRQTQTSR